MPSFLVPFANRLLLDDWIADLPDQSLTGNESAYGALGEPLLIDSANDSAKVLLNQIRASSYERAVTEKKTHNFDLALPEHFAEQADEMLKSSYNLEFPGLRRAVRERELEDRLISRLQAILLELGYGFCFVGRQHRLA